MRKHDWLFSGGGEGASAVLGAIAGSMITIAGVVFSLTLLALSLASQQFGPRLLRNFMRDRANQVVLGTFIATFLYCLLVLRTIRRADDAAFVPHLSVTLGVLFAIASLGVLIYFVHHVAVSIQADELVSVVGTELLQSIDRLFPEHIGGEIHGCRDGDPDLPATFAREACPVVAREDGYLQLVDSDDLMTVAKEHDLVLQLHYRPGHYIVAGSPLLRAWPAQQLDEGIRNRINGAFILGGERTSTQDIEYVIGQLVEIAVRALSPGVNDPFTAITCVDRLGSALHRLAQREMPSPQRYDDEHKLRVVAPATSFAALLDAAFNQIRP
jgi:uncharacterized membrane protein